MMRTTEEIREILDMQKTMVVTNDIINETMAKLQIMRQAIRVFHEKTTEILRDHQRQLREKYEKKREEEN